MRRIRDFFFPPAGASWLRRLVPWGVLGVVLFLGLVGVSYAWDYTNSPEFCGTTCHTMPPEFAAYQVSPHARVLCVECHIGRGFVATRITRKAGDLEHVFSTLFNDYEYPIRADKLRPARETCERCHYPEKFSDDSLRENIRFANDAENSQSSVFLAMHTGGGSSREGLGRGIHWHVENEVWFVAEDELQQSIPYVRVVGPDGAEDVYVALDAQLSSEALESMTQVKMDCITCHNRISHYISPPHVAVDEALSRRQIDADIPYIRARAIEVLAAEYATDAEAHAAIDGLAAHYAEEYPEFYAGNEASVQEAIDLLTAVYDDSVFRDQQVDWDTHPNNIGHQDWPGCFRCHDGQHVNTEGQAIRLECNLCHSIPLVVQPGTIEPELPLVTGIQPESHFNTHWIALHRDALDQTCQACHDVSNAGGTDNSSFCSNSACHGVSWEYAGLDAPGLADVLAANRPPAPAEPPPEPSDAALTFDAQIGPLFESKCGTCHSAQVATGGLALTTHEGVMAGGASGAVVVPGDAAASLLVAVQQGEHFATLSESELQAVMDWIDAGAPAGAQPEPEAVAPSGDAGAALTYEADVAPLFESRCGTCHSAQVASGGLALTTYEGVMAGGEAGAVVVPGDAAASLLVAVQQGEHFATLSADELQTVTDWIDAGAPAGAEPEPEAEAPRRCRRGAHLRGRCRAALREQVRHVPQRTGGVGRVGAHHLRGRDGRRRERRGRRPWRRRREPARRSAAGRALRGAQRG
ncbi:MAG: NapC/NirT family cytochrome c [Anaerolineae bacterium]|nr:NapC/NirT family cytochrome c [Anaerolineae bacterium]